jgi:hypothetical protein
MAKVARGKALVAQLRRQAGVRDAEALAAFLGRFRRARKAGRSVAEAQKIARGEEQKKKPAGGLADRLRDNTPPKRETKPSVMAKRDPFEDDAPFAEDYGENEPKSKEDLQRERMEAKLLRDMERADRAKLYKAIMDQGGLKSRAELREEYAGIPNTYKRKDGLAGDELADHLAICYPELGIESERDLIDYLAV